MPNEMRPTDKLLLRAGEAAHILGLGRSKVYEMAAAGELPAVRIGSRCIRIPADALRLWVQDRQTDGGE